MANGEHSPTDWTKAISTLAVVALVIFICLIALSV